MTKHRLALSASCALFAGSLAFGQGAFVSPEIVVASNTLTMVAGPSGLLRAPSWTTNTSYAQGAVVKSQAVGPAYFALVGGTSTNIAAASPSGLGNITEGTVTWRKVLSSPRQTLTVQDVGTNSACRTYVFTNYGSGTNLASVIMLYGGSGFSWGPGECPQSAVYVLATQNTRVTVGE
jgi:hypothetical protein